MLVILTERSFFDLFRPDLFSKGLAQRLPVSILLIDPVSTVAPPLPWPVKIIGAKYRDVFGIEQSGFAERSHSPFSSSQNFERLRSYAQKRTLLVCERFHWSHAG